MQHSSYSANDNDAVVAAACKDDAVAMPIVVASLCSGSAALNDDGHTNHNSTAGADEEEGDARETAPTAVVGLSPSFPAGSARTTEALPSWLSSSLLFPELQEPPLVTERSKSSPLRQNRARRRAFCGHRLRSTTPRPPTILLPVAEGKCRVGRGTTLCSPRSHCGNERCQLVCLASVRQPWSSCRSSHCTRSFQQSWALCSWVRRPTP